MAEEAVLIDSSIWILALRPGAPESLSSLLAGLVESGRARITEMVRLEIIGGARSSGELGEILLELKEVPCLKTATDQWRKAENMGLPLSRAGRRTAAADTLIAAVAVSYRVPLWHADRDFEQIRMVISELRTFWYPKHSPTV